MIDLAEIRAACDAATPGPWDVETIRDLDESFVICDVVRWRGYTNSLNFGEDRRTAEFVAQSREWLPALVDEVEQLRAENERLRAGLAASSPSPAEIEAATDEIHSELFDADWPAYIGSMDGDTLHSICRTLASAALLAGRSVHTQEDRT